MSAGSSEFRATGATFLQLKVTVNRGQGPEDVWMGVSARPGRRGPPPFSFSGADPLSRVSASPPPELTLPQFYSFLHEMEKAKAGLEVLA